MEIELINDLSILNTRDGEFKHIPIIEGSYTVEVVESDEITLAIGI